MATSFPNSVWDGTTGTRPNYSVNRGPTGIDWDRCVEEIRSMQRFLTGEGGPFRWAGRTVTEVNESTTDDDQVIYIDATSNDVTVAVPDPSLHDKRVITYKRIDGSANVVTLNGTIDGVSNPTLIEGESYTIHSHLLTWRLI